MNSRALVDLLDAVRIRAASLAQAKTRYAAELAPDFHLLDHLHNNEVALSRYLGLLLDPKGVHGQGELFLQSFLQRFEISGFKPSELLRITLEQRTDNGRFLDIYLEFKDGLLGIENKPWAADQDQQLADYAEFLQRRAQGKPWRLLYLCNGEPSPASLADEQRQTLEGAGQFARIDFYQIAEWLAACACLARAPKVRLFVEALSDYVRQRVNGEMEMGEAEQIKAVILEKPEHLEAALKVAQSIEQVKRQLLTAFKQNLGKALNEQGLGLVWEDQPIESQRTYAGFGAKLNNQDPYHLRFEFGGSKLSYLEWGICRDNKQITLDPSDNERIAAAMDRRFGTGHRGEHWPWYIKIEHDPVLQASERNWGVEAEPWLRMSDSSEQGFVARIVKLALDVKRALAE